MIFKQVKEIIEGTKTQTRRVVKDGERWKWEGEFVPFQTVLTPSGRKKWAIGQEYAVVPKRAMPQVFYRYSDDGELQLAHEHLMPHVENSLQRQPTQLEFAKIISMDDWKSYLSDCGYSPLYIQLTDIRQEPLLSISETDAIAEGIKTKYHSIAPLCWDYKDCEFKPITAVDSYKSLWESINGQGSWDKNPTVWVLEFEKA